MSITAELFRDHFRDIAPAFMRLYDARVVLYCNRCWYIWPTCKPFGQRPISDNDNDREDVYR